MKNQDKSVTIRINKDIYQILINKAISNSVKDKKIIKISEIIRMAIENYIK